MEKSNAKARGYLGTASAVKILDFDAERSYLCFSALLGTCEIAIGDSTFNNVKIDLAVGEKWEPDVTLMQEVWFRGLNSKLVVVS